MPVVDGFYSSSTIAPPRTDGGYTSSDALVPYVDGAGTSSNGILTATLYGTYIITDTPLAHWPLTEGGGAITTTMYDIRGGNHGVYSGTPTSSLPVETYAPSSTKFTGTSQNGVAANWASLDSFATGRTYELWFRVPTTNVARTIFSHANGASSVADTLFYVQTNTSGQLVCNYRSPAAGGSFVTLSTTPIAANTVYHVVITVSAGTGSYTPTINTYVNMAQASSAALSFAPITGLGIRIGSALSGADGNGVEMNDVAVYNTVLTTTTITNHYEMGAYGRLLTNVAGLVRGHSGWGS